MTRKKNVSFFIVTVNIQFVEKVQVFFLLEDLFHSVNILKHYGGL